ncbi:glycosyltransferase family 4 protein [Patescibacteria group bacterium]|nr:glycosyltransferase family 4 protein [Patescibacteria group bacterium]
MKILLVSSYLPYPLFSGGQVRLYNIIKHLSKNHEITLICEKRSNQTQDDIHEMEKFCKKVITVERKKQWSYSNILKTGFSTNPFLITGHSHLEMRKKIQKELAENKYDLIHVETFYVMQNLPSTTLPVVLVEHNIEYLVYKRYADNASFLFKPLLYADVLKLKRKEKESWKKATKVIAVSEQERKLMTRKDIVVVPNGVDTEKFESNTIETSREVKLLYLGDFRWMTNTIAAKWLLTDIWPKIKSEIKNQKPGIEVKLKVVGRKIPEKIKALGGENVTFDEKAADTQKIYQDADILVAPIRVGGGTSFKILEAMATGVAVVTTSLGIEGINAEEGKEFLLGNNTNEIVVNVCKLIKDTNLRKEITRNARILMEEKYDWKKIVRMLESVYSSVI